MHPAVIPEYNVWIDIDPAFEGAYGFDLFAEIEQFEVFTLIVFFSHGDEYRSSTAFLSCRPYENMRGSTRVIWAAH